jgi:hypothetical protein
MPPVLCFSVSPRQNPSGPLNGESNPVEELADMTGMVSNAELLLDEA